MPCCKVRAAGELDAPGSRPTPDSATLSDCHSSAFANASSFVRRIYASRSGSTTARAARSVCVQARKAVDGPAHCSGASDCRSAEVLSSSGQRWQTATCRITPSANALMLACPTHASALEVDHVSVLA